MEVLIKEDQDCCIFYRESDRNLNDRVVAALHDINP